MSDNEGTREEDGRRRSSRRVISSTKEKRKSALDELRNARLAGKCARPKVDNLVKDVYETVTEDEYQEIRRQRARQTFVEDDDGAGYFDDGTIDDFDDIENEYDEPKSSKKARLADKKKQKKGMYAYLNVNVPSRDKASENTPCNIDEDPDVMDLLNQMGQSHTDDNFGIDNPLNILVDSVGQSSLDITSTWPSASPFVEEKTTSIWSSAFSFDVEEEKTQTEEPTVIADSTIEMTLNKSEKAQKRPASADLTDDVPSPKVIKLDDSTLRMYWVETFEDVHKNPGSVYLFGKLGSQSCCVVVKNIPHKVYFLPRKLDGDIQQNLAEVKAEVERGFLDGKFFESSSKDYGFKAEIAHIKWIPTNEHISREVPALMVTYKGHLPKIPQNTEGNTFSHVLNTTATSMERLLLEANLRGPCWIDIKNAAESKKRFSHCNLEYVINMMSGDDYNICASNIKKPSPFITLMSLNVVSVPSSDGKETEIIMISGLYQKKGLLDRANKAAMVDYDKFCLVTHPKKGVMPLNFDTEVEKMGAVSNSISKMPSERALLNLFFARLKQLDPDVIIAHDVSAQICLLVSRAEKYSIKTLSFISRLNRTQAPGRFLKTKAGQWELMAGRSVLCSKTAAEELYPTRSYELGDLIPLLMPNTSRVALTHEQLVEPFMNTSSKVLVSQLIGWSWLEAYYALQVVLQLNALPLFVQITQIVGGVLSRTLLGGRSERNEYLLLHAFHESGYIPPDKHLQAKKQNKAAKNEAGAEEEEMKGAASKKAQYTGGLVLEPKKGFYDTFIVLLDFNSLYPSIIQEFNICFTTIDRCYEEPNENGLPEAPGDTVPEGILPIQIGNLVRSRQEIKAQMKKVNPGTDEYLRLDVRQKGLKLTANSMYGCLGFGMSRFCAKTLAAMITSKGRELLSQTKIVVEKQGYTVVYGDTDSIMVNTNTTSYGDACRLASNLRKIVNGGFKHVEMDVDGLFKRLLLLKKKKYAALTVSLSSEVNVKKEMKGLDIVRRDWSKLARDVGERVVDLILNSKMREDLIKDIVATLNQAAENLEKMPLEDFEILKQLTKAPSEYADVKNQPHVSVALRLNASKAFNIRPGDVVKYVICEDGTDNSAYQRAYHLSELNASETLSIDTHYYLSQQIHPVVMRLCEPFSELDSSRIAESLGLDPSSYRHNAASRGAYGMFDLTTGAFDDLELADETYKINLGKILAGFKCTF